ncbi:MAG: hypothetical protein ACR2OZ_05545 [Verrucomicrobiales bacterium]
MSPGSAGQTNFTVKWSGVAGGVFHIQSSEDLVTWVIERVAQTETVVASEIVTVNLAVYRGRYWRVRQVF